MTAATDTLQHAHTPWYRDVKVLRIVAQVGAVVIAVGITTMLLLTARSNLADRGISTDFGFITQPTQFEIGESGFSSSSPIWRAVLEGAKNTGLVVAIGIPLTTLLGVLIGIARLSKNFLLRKAAAMYVETLRNIPPLLVILFTNTIILTLPIIQEGATPFGLFVVSNRRFAMPSIVNGDNSGIFWFCVLGALIATVVVWRWRTRVFNETGQLHHRVLWGLGTFFLISVAAFLILGDPILLSKPVLVPEERLIVGGTTMLAGYATVTLALTLYTASHIAEIVRGSILAVPKGQTEASFAVGLTNFQRYRFVVLPQAARIAIPPTINQYLNFTKNTSLAIAVGFAEITVVAVTIIGNGNPAPQTIAILMLVYLAFSLSLSFVMNRVNRRLQLATQR
ncbi:MAG: ABC transporter permease subunit [Acidimicrobiia bacterium]|nr:ABC transporter permease subunit [Acidimicrobiia bacterium]